MRVPSYWRFHGRPVRIVKTEDGGLDVQQFDPETLGWERRLTHYAAILGGDPDADELTEQDFERWIAALQAGATAEEAWEDVLARSSALVEGTVEAIDGNKLRVRGRWWKAEGGLAPSIRAGDWVQLRPESEDAEDAVITELRPARR